MNIIPLFSKPLYSNSLNENVISLIDITGPLKSENNKFSTSRQKDFYILEKEENYFLKSLIENEIKQFLNEELTPWMNSSESVPRPHVDIEENVESDNLIVQILKSLQSPYSKSRWTPISNSAGEEGSCNWWS